MIPYGKQSIDEDDIEAVVEVLRSYWLTTGPKVTEFEEAMASFVGAKYAVAVGSGTAALHTAMFALNIGPGDEVIVPPMTFAATANCIVYQGGTPVFADIEPDTLLINPEQVEKKITSRTKAIIAVDYAGQPCDYDVLTDIAHRHGLVLVADACHSLGATYKGRNVGILANLSAFSFHPVKHITTGEGGMIITDDRNLAERMYIFRNHGITLDYRERVEKKTWFYEMSELGYNYRLTDLQCALGISQLRKLPRWLQRRREIAKRYDKAFSEVSGMQPLCAKNDRNHAYHLYVMRFNAKKILKKRDEIFTELRAKGIGVNVHYIPVHFHPYYQKNFHVGPGLCPVAEKAYNEILSLPIYHGMSDEDVDKVISAMKNVVETK